MPLKLLQNLCSEPPDGRAEKRLDDLAMKIFGQTAFDEFILSRELPAPRYKISVDSNVLNQVTKLDYNDSFLPSFSVLGPNEKYIVHKIFYSTNNIVSVIGGIGVGKTAFTHYYIRNLLPTIRHSDEKDPKRCPAVVIFDFKAFDRRVFPREPEAAAVIGFSKNLALQISSRLAAAGYFNISEEVRDVWDHLMEEDDLQNIQNPALSWLRGRLHADNLALDPTKTYDQRALDTNLSRRKNLREEIVDSDYSMAYFAALLGYIKKKFYSDHSPCLVVIIDNVDRELPSIHRIAEDQLKIFANLCDVRIVFNVRQTTHHQGTDNFQQLVDKVPYCGPDPLEIVYARLDNFLEKGTLYEKCSEVYGPLLRLEEFHTRLGEYRNKALSDARFTAFFRALCGGSVRKGLKIAQNIIHTSIFDLTDKDDNRPFSPNNVIRALMVGPNDYYNENGVVENLFRIADNNKLAYFLKIRILKALNHSHDNGLTLRMIVRSLEHFGYEESLILDAVHDLLRRS